jgi:gas vesicle protein
MPNEKSARPEGDASGSLVWFVAGATLGFGAALLLAPRSGRETRRLLAERAAQGRDAVAGKGREWAGAGREVFERGQKLAEDAADLFDRGRKMVRG